MLEIKKLNVFYGKVHVIKDLSLRVEEGECVTLLGANGAGKSTLINTICGLVPPHGRFHKPGGARYQPHACLQDRPSGYFASARRSTDLCEHVRDRQPAARGLLQIHRRDQRRKWARTWTASWKCFQGCGNAEANSRAPFPEASSRCWPSVGRSCADRKCCCWTNRPLDLLHWWCNSYLRPSAC